MIMMHRFSKLSYFSRRACNNQVYSSVRNCTLFKEEKDTLQQAKNIPENLPIVKKVSKTNKFLDSGNITSLLKIATAQENPKHAFEALGTLADLRHTKNNGRPISFKDIEKNKHFPKLLHILDKRASKRPEREIIKAIEDLMVIGFPANRIIVETLENDLLWSVSRVSFGTLLHIFNFQVRHQETERQRKVLELASSEIKRRWSEVRYPYEYLSLYNLSSQLEANLLNQVDERLMEFMEEMDGIDLSKIFVAISNSKRRPTPLLRSLAFHMFKKDDKFKFKEIVNVMYAMNTLSFIDEALLVKLSTDFLAQIGDLTEPSVIRGVIQCMGHMRWKEKAIINAVSEWIVKNIEICRTNEIVGLILTLASVNFKPDNFEELISVCVSKLDLSDNCDKLILIDIVWSLTILGKAPNDLISRVLNHSFIEGIPLFDPPKVGVCLKLLNINAVANTLIETYTGERLKLPINDSMLLTQSRKDLALHDHIFKILHNILPPPKYIKEHVNTDMGFTVDAEIILDKQQRPLNVSDYSTAFGTIESPNPLPEGARRIALMIWSYRDYTIGNQSILGQNSLAVELLQKRGYKVAQIPYFDINRRDKTLKGIQYFERKFKEL